MAHIESGECMRISVEDIEAARQRKQEFPQKLEALTKEPVKSNYAKYMPRSQDDIAVDDEFASWRKQKEQTPAPKFESTDFPELPPHAQNASANAGPLTDNKSATDQDKPPAWSQKENLFPKAGPAQRPTQQQLKEATGPSARQLFEEEDRDHPDHPDFYVARYFCNYAQNYRCPKRGCMCVSQD